MQLQAISTAEAEAQFNKELARVGYQNVLNAVAQIEYTRDNVGQDLLAPATEVLTKLKEKKLAFKRPYLDIFERVDEIFNSLYGPLNQLVEEKQAQRKRIVQEINAENARIEAENRRKKELQDKINEYLRRWTDMALSATTTQSLNKLEAQINLAKGRPLEFKEMHENFIERCDAILPIIRQQKEKVGELEAVMADFERAKQENDEELHKKSIEKELELSRKLRAEQDELQNKAFEAISTEIVQNVVHETIKPSRKQFKWRVDDINLLAKKRPDLVNVVPNEEKIRETVRQVKGSMLKSKQKEVNISGLVIYIDETYK